MTGLTFYQYRYTSSAAERTYAITFATTEEEGSDLNLLTKKTHQTVYAIFLVLGVMRLALNQHSEINQRKIFDEAKLYREHVSDSSVYAVYCVDSTNDWINNTPIYIPCINGKTAIFSIYNTRTRKELFSLETSPDHVSVKHRKSLKIS